MTDLRLDALKSIQDSMHTTDQISKIMKIPTQSLHRVLDDLWMLELVEKHDLTLQGKGYGWSVTEATLNELKKARLL
jgi:predicted transcriptional regulator